MNMSTITGDLKMIGGQSYVVFNKSYNSGVILSNDSSIAKKIKKVVDVSKIDEKEDKVEYSDYDVIIIIGNNYDDKF